MRILLVEDDLMIGQAMVQALTDASHAVDWVDDGQKALSALAVEDYGVLLLDLGLAVVDGVAVLRSLRRTDPSLPVLVVTARDEVDSRVDVLDLGADDYLVKPFDLKELLARIRAVVRRKGGSGAPTLSVGGLSLDPATHELVFGKECCRLSGREFALMEALMRRPGAIRSKADLEGHIYGWNQDIDSNTIEVLIHGLRRKLGAGVIRTVRGAGYMVDRTP